MPDSSKDRAFSLNYTVLKDLAGKNRNGYLGVFENSTGKFSIVPPAHSDCKNGAGAKVSETAEVNHCMWATNGGPFTYDGPGKKSYGCQGVIISNGRILADTFGSAGTQFGSTESGSWFVGNVHNASEAQELGIKNLITAFDWIVYNGTATVSTPGGERAPRTAVGVDDTGRLMSLVVDGCEKCKEGKGPTMKEISDVMVQLGASYAVNLDGGGSSTIVVNDTVKNHPTCIDVIFPCERRVTSAVCMSH